MTDVPGVGEPAADEPALIRDALSRLQERLHLDAIDQATVIRWDVVTVRSTLNFQLAAGDGRWVFSDGVPAASRLAIALGVDDLLVLAVGRLSAPQAFLSGRLRLSGDLALAEAVLPGFDLLTAPRPDPRAP